jgi:hypothetical protein
LIRLTTLAMCFSWTVLAAKQKAILQLMAGNDTGKPFDETQRKATVGLAVFISSLNEHLTSFLDHLELQRLLLQPSTP